MIQLIAWVQFWIVVSAALAVLYIGYCWVIRREERFGIHRFTLLAIILFSLFTPFLVDGVDKLLNIMNLGNGAVNAQSTENLANRWNVLIHSMMQQRVELNSGSQFPWHWLALAVITVSTLLILRFIYQLVRLARICQKSEVQCFGEFNLVKSNLIQQPFSFWHWVFVPTHFNDANDQHEILEHEKIHVSQMHSVDLLLIELLAAAMWFNPVMWMIRKRIRLIHEYLADEGALSTGIDARRYKALLLNQVTEERLICLSSSFNHSLIKKRMIMISKNKSNEKSSMRLLAFVPLSLVMVVIVIGLKGFLPDAAQASTLAVTQGNTSAADSSKTITVSGTGSLAVIYVVDGKRVDNVDNIKPEEIFSVDVNKATNTVNVTTKKAAVNTKKEEPQALPDFSTTQIFVDGVEQTDKDILSKIDPQTIESVSVKKDSVAIMKLTNNKYDAVIEIITKK